MVEQDLVPFAPAPLPAGPWLVFAPHPDDEVLGMGGTLALAARAGIHVEVVVVTGGDQAGDPAARRQEALAAGAILGVARHHFWELPDRGVERAPFPRQALRELLAALRPATIFLPALQEYHPDHRATTRRVRAELGGAPVWLYEITRQSEANRLVDITAVNDVKGRAIACFASQLAISDYAGLTLGNNRARALTLGPAVTHAEAFWDSAASEMTSLEAVGRYLAVAPPLAGGQPVLSQPRVTVIVRTKDRPALLRQALASIAAQSHPGVEVVVVNDGGADVAALCGGARLVTLPENRGRAAAANRGLAEARTPLVAFLDDDDLFLPGAIETLVGALGDRPAVYGRVQLRHFDAGGGPTGEDDRELGRPFDRDALLIENYIPLNAILFRRELLDEVGGFREDLPFLEDWELLLRLSDRWTPELHDAPVAIYRSFGGVSTVAGNRFSEEDFHRTVRAIMRERWPEVTPAAVQAHGHRLAAAFEARRRELASTRRPLATPWDVPVPAAAGRTKLLLLCPEPLRSQQQGIGIRFREMAQELSAAHEVVLYAPNQDLPAAAAFAIRTYDEADLVRELPGAAAVIVQGHVSEAYFAALDRHAIAAPPPLVCDLYDPFLVENLCYAGALGSGVYLRDRAVLLRQLARGDRFLVSSRAQIAFYVGLMMGQGLFAPGDAVEELFVVAPFGVRPPAAATPEGTRAEPVIFFGGIYDWYDPHLLLDAVLELPAPPRVLFTANPNPDTTPQRVYASVQERVARDPALARVAFVPWFPYEERHARLAEVDVAVSLHRPSLETDVSLRTRVLEYLSCGLPVVATDGGETAAILAASGGGRLVPPGDRAALREVLRELLGDPALRRRLGAQGSAWVRRHMSWSQTLAPLRAYCQAPTPRRPRPTPFPADAPAPVIESGAGGPRFSVVVPSYDGRELLADCLGSLEAQRFPRAGFEVIVVDNGSRDGSAAFVHERFPAARVVALPRNTGFTGAIAAGAGAARGETLVLLNNDMRVDPGWLAAYAEAGGDCATGRILDWSGEKVDFVGAILTFDGHALQRYQGSPAAAFRDLAARETFIATGGNMAVRRALFNALGGFDGDYFAYSEDVDFSWRLHAAGHRVRFVPGALAYHHGAGTSTRTLGVYRRGILFETNAFATLFKNIDAPYFDALLHAAWRALINRTLHILATHAPGAGILGPAAPPPAAAQPRLRDRLRALRRLGPRAAVGKGLRALGELVDAARDAGPAAELRHPHALSQLEAVGRVLAGVDRLHEKRAAVQAGRVRSDADIFRVYPPWIVDTYPGDQALFASPAFRRMLPRDIPFRFASVGEVHDGTAPVGHHPDL